MLCHVDVPDETRSLQEVTQISFNLQGSLVVVTSLEEAARYIETYVGKRREEKGRDGKRREETGRDGKRTEEKGREGKKREEKGREGKRRKEKGRKGKKREGRKTGM